MPGQFSLLPTYTSGIVEAVTFVTLTNRTCQEAWGTDQSRVTRYYRVDWNRRHDARQALLGTVIFEDNGGNQAYFTRIAPHALTDLEETDTNAHGFTDNYLDEFGLPWLYCVAVPSMTGAGSEPSEQGVPVWKWAILEAVYEGLPFDILSDAAVINEDLGPNVTDESPGPGIAATRWVSREVKDAVKFLETRGFAWHWIDEVNGGADLNNSVSSAVPLMVPGQLVTYTWYQVPRVHAPYEVYRTLHGTTNDEAFDGYEAHTLVFLGYDEEPKRLHDGQRTVNIKLKMRHHPLGVNFFPDPRRNNAFHQIVAADGASPHEPADFNTLFRPVLI